MASGQVQSDGTSEGVTLPGSVPNSTVGRPGDGAEGDPGHGEEGNVVGPRSAGPSRRRPGDSEVAPAGFDSEIDAARARMTGQQLGEGEG